LGGEVLSPPFEGGVAGTNYYQAFTNLYFPDGVVDFMGNIIKLKEKKSK